jgi:hypothetical protein
VQPRAPIPTRVPRVLECHDIWQRTGNTLSTDGVSSSGSTDRDGTAPAIDRPAATRPIVTTSPAKIARTSPSRDRCRRTNPSAIRISSPSSGTNVRAVRGPRAQGLSPTRRHNHRVP